ncbi:acyltransferase family protein [Ancylobacter sp. VNQ12]|uniref:acyltransferase family protein n=1 Tax=Ancylobacter sp. VNQ12 TaxID=3400920 RepID=UPI003C04765F
MHSRLHYRAHIDGLRAIAVLGVVIFHFGATWLPGGFIGVDVFFVISGFLISKSLYRDILDGTFSLSAFYERRARRIAPAFIAVTLLTSIAAFFILYPWQLSSYSVSVMFSSLFSANIYFYLKSDYFAPAAEELPLLHYWSLGVEEQFYIFFPFIVILCCKFARRALPHVLLALFLASLVACEVFITRDPSAAFYLLPFRAFELLIGAMLALPAVRFTESQTMGAAAVTAGTALILVGMMLLTNKSHFPGATALVPCIGAALLIWGGERSENIPAKLLSTPVMRFFGQISYSLYLVHWPLVVFSRMLWPDLSGLVFLIGGCAASVILGWLSWKFVEQPPRRKGGLFFPRRAILGLTAAAMVTFIGAAGVIRMANGFPGRMAVEVQQILAFGNYAYQPVFREGTCFLRPEQGPADLDTICLSEDRPDVVLWGSSHVAQFFGGLEPALRKRGYALGQITGSGCIPLVDYDNPQRPNCRALNAFALEWILANRPSIVVMGGDPITDPVMLALFDASVQKLHKAGIDVVVLGPVPYFRRTVPVILAERLGRGDNDMMSDGELLPISSAADKFLADYYRTHSDARYISFIEAMCPNTRCRLEVGMKPLHFDTVHFTAIGSEYYGSRIVDLIINRH